MKNENELIRVEAVPSTPFALLTKENGKIVVIIGNNIVSQEYDKDDEAINYIKEKNWELLTATIGVIAESIINQKNNKNE